MERKSDREQSVKVSLEKVKLQGGKIQTIWCWWEWSSFFLCLRTVRKPLWRGKACCLSWACGLSRLWVNEWLIFLAGHEHYIQFLSRSSNDAMPVVTSSIFQVSSLALLSREHLLRNILVIPSYPLPYPSSTKPTLEKLGLLSNYIVFKLDLNIKKNIRTYKTII
jgi:hypothetical protein